MNVLVRNLLIFAAVLTYAGCAGEYEEAARQSASREAPPEVTDAEANAPADVAEIPADEEPATADEDSQPASVKPTEPSPPPRSRPPAEPQRRTGPSISLSAGVALPQSLPTGTAMGISVDYTFTIGQPRPSLAYVWVIEAANADSVKQSVQLNLSGTLQQFFTQLRPQHGPFHTHIESSDGTRLSRSMSLR